MINSKKKYYHYLRCDKLALNIDDRSLASRMKLFFLPNKIWNFQRLLRKLEFFKNVKLKKSKFYYLHYVYLKFKFRKLSLKLGFSIPENVFGPGLAIIHYGTIIVNSRAKVGANCRIHACTNIGESGGVVGAPKIGDNVYIAPGAKIYGNINIPNNCAIAANAAVSKSFFNEGVVIGGVPARELGNIDIKQIIKHI